MRGGRVTVPKHQPVGYYHCHSRVVDKRAIFTNFEKERFAALLREVESFTQVRVLTHAVMSNHFHVLIAVEQPPQGTLTGDDLVRCYQQAGEEALAQELEKQLSGFRRQQNQAQEQECVSKRLARMWNISSFMKDLKQGFTREYNQRHERSGTLWEGRFKSTIAEGGRALLAIAAYIDLNSVRAWQAHDPKDYRWSGYAEAEAGGKKARKGIQRVIHEAERSTEATEEEALRKYRMVVYRLGCEEGKALDEEGKPKKGGLKREEVEKVLKNQGRLGLEDYVMCRVKYFGEGMVLGSREFVEKMYEENRKRIGKLRKAGAKRLQGLEEEVYSLKDWKNKVFG